jgi:tetratricopeptide (TPR) repeat protein
MPELNESLRTEFESAIAAARLTPDSQDVWDQVESLAGDLDCPDEVARAYRDVLYTDLAPELAVSLGKRAARLHDEWFGDDPRGIEDVLRRVLHVDPKSEWAFQRFTVVLTVAERWDELLGLYDQAIAASVDPTRREKLLDEAAQVAKDVANRPQKAISYLQQLLPLRPGDAQLGQSLERLLERHECWRDLIALWETQLAELTPAERETARARIAACWLDRLDDAGQALEALRPLLAEARDDRRACELLEQIVTRPGAPAEVREGALALLRTHHESGGRPREVVRLLEAALARIEALPEAASVEGQREQRALHQEAAERLAALGDDAAAMEHYAALLHLDPLSTVTQEQLRQLAARSRNYQRYASSLASAAEVCDHLPRRVKLLAEAARTRAAELGDIAGAIDLYRTAFELPDIGEGDMLMTGHKLSRLLGQSGRNEERLAIIEKLATVEESETNRRAVLGEAARMAEALGDVERALGAWRKRLDDNPHDIEALNALVGLLESSARWGALIDALERRVLAPVPANQKRADLVRIAQVQRHELGNPQRAIDTWRRVQNEHGESRETVDELTELYGETGRWSELAELLERACRRESDQVTERWVKLGEAYGQHLGQPERAVLACQAALEIDPQHAGARAALTALLELAETRARAAEALAGSYRHGEEWAELARLTEARLSGTDDPRGQLTILREAAAAHEKIGDRAGAAEVLARALPLAPHDQVLEDHLVELAQATGTVGAAVAGLRTAAGQVQDDVHCAARLRTRAGQLLERVLDLPGDACDDFTAAAGLVPASREAVPALVRLGSRLGRWPDVAASFLSHTRAIDQVDEALLDAMAAGASGRTAWDEATSALERALGDTGTPLPARLVLPIWWRLAQWHRDHRDDAASTEAALARVVELDTSRPEPLRALAALREGRPGRELFVTLRQLSEADPADLDACFAAAEVAVQHLNDPVLARPALVTLLGRATQAWQGGSTMHSSREPRSCVAWAVDQLVELYCRTDEARSAVDLLVDAARLPFDAGEWRALRLRTAEIASQKLGDTATAMEMYRAVLQRDPSDMAAISRLAELYQAEERTPELLALRTHELTLEATPERRLELRLEIARLVGLVEERGGRLEVLRKNLDEQPGHAASIDALYQALDAKARHKELFEVLSEQAGRLETLHAGDRAAALWMRAALLAENQLHNIDAALGSYRRVVALQPDPAALDALARLHLSRREPLKAVPWLEQRLQRAADADSRSAIVLRLAHAHLDGDQRDQAIACLEQAIRKSEQLLPLRTLLAELYRTSQAWAPLARHLTESLPHLADERMLTEWAREAADIYHGRLRAPDKAIPALEKAVSLSPGDRTLRLMLAKGLRVDGRLSRARELLGELLGDFGRRRSSERAQIHVELGLVEWAEGRLEEALKELDMASRMDSANATIQRMHAELAYESGNVEQAERTYRALLLLVRRQPPAEDVDAVGPAEVLYALHRISRERQSDEQARELLESALEAAAASDIETQRLKRTLLPRGEHEILLRALRMRLAAAEQPESQTRLLTDCADVLEEQNQHEEALQARLKAVQLVPTDMALHDAARRLAARAGRVADYVECVGNAIEKLRRSEEGPQVARLLMRLGEVSERELGQPAVARDYYRRVEETGLMTAEALFALARVCGALGETAEQSRAIDALYAQAEQDEEHSQADALYRLAELEVGSEAHRSRGISTLYRALDVEPRHADAARILRAAAEAAPDDEQILVPYEQVARASGDWEMLLDFLERRARLPHARPEQIEEAVAVAFEHDQDARGEALLVRAVDVARQSFEGLSSAVWAVAALAERRTRAGDLQSGRDLFMELAEVASHDQVFDLGKRIAGAAHEAGALAQAAEIYEYLRERSPAARSIWEPLFAIHRKSGNTTALQALVGGTLPVLVEPAERNSLRLLYARYLLEELREQEVAVETLRDILLDDPDHLEATTLLEQILGRGGDSQALADFLWQRFEDARRRRNPETVTALAWRLGELLDRIGSVEALAVYRAALEIAPDDRSLLRQVLDHMGGETDPRERAVLTERLLGGATGQEAAHLGRKLVELWRQLGDSAGVQRALELSCRLCPEDGELRGRLASWYREQERWPQLVEMIRADAERLAQPPTGKKARPEQLGRAVELLREAAAVYRDCLGDASGAAATMRRALELMPASEQLVLELAGALAAAGELRDAITTITTALDQELPVEARVDLLLSRSDLLLSTGDAAAALADLDQAHGLQPERVTPFLVSALEHQLERARASGQTASEREAVLRLSKLLISGGDLERARGVLGDWITRQPDDGEALYALGELETRCDNWTGLLAVCGRLVAIETGEAQIHAASTLAEAADKLGNPALAREGLERVHRDQPENAAVRKHLRRIYELAEDHRELANLLMRDAEHGGHEKVRYECYRQAAEIFALRLGDAHAAIAPARMAQELRPDDHDTILLMADVLTVAGQLDDAVALLEPTIENHRRRSPKLAELQQRMARICAARGDQENQLNWLKKAFDVDRKSGEVAAELAQLATEMGDYELALKPLRAITLMENPQPITRVMALLWEAKIEHARGNRAKAELWAKKALREDPNFQEAHEFLAEIAE